VAATFDEEIEKRGNEGGNKRAWNDSSMRLHGTRLIIESLSIHREFADLGLETEKKRRGKEQEGGLVRRAPSVSVDIAITMSSASPSEMEKEVKKGGAKKSSFA